MQFYLPGRQAPIIYEARLDSTNTQLKRLAREGAEHGTVLIAGEQTGGRGRQGKNFASPQKGVYLSILLRPKCRAEDIPTITANTAVAISLAIEAQCGICPDIKWLNDLQLNGRKICGILAEMCDFGTDGAFIVLGIGINVNTAAEDFPPELRQSASSILLETGRETELEELAIAELREIDRMYEAWLQNPRVYLEQYRARCITSGRQVLLIQNGSAREARALRVDDDFALVVETAEGEETISFGEVSIRTN